MLKENHQQSLAIWWVILLFYESSDTTCSAINIVHLHNYMCLNIFYKQLSNLFIIIIIIIIHKLTNCLLSLSSQGDDG